MMAMNQATRLSFFGAGWVIPKVLMKALERNRSGRMVIDDTEKQQVAVLCIRAGRNASYLGEPTAIMAAGCFGVD